MPENDSKLHAARILVTAGMVVILVAGLKLAQSFFVPVLLAAFIATVSSSENGNRGNPSLPPSQGVNIQTRLFVDPAQEEWEEQNGYQNTEVSLCSPRDLSRNL